MKNKIAKYWNAFRLNEVILMSGFFIIGGIFAIEEITIENSFKLFLLSLLSFSIVFSVYAFNAAAGKELDKNNLRLKNLWDLNKNSFLSFSIICFVTALIISYFLKPFSAALTTIIIAIWILYSHPVFGLKQKAVWGTLIHFFGQIMHFNLAFLIFSEISLNSILISIFFAIAFSSGHLLHEIIDYDADKKAGLKTSAIIYGIKNTTKALFGLLFLNIVLLFSLLYFSIISRTVFYPFAFASISHFLLIFHFYYSKKISALKVRNTYRIIYLISGIVYWILIIFNNFS